MAVKHKNMINQTIPSSPEVRLQIILRALQNIQPNDGANHINAYKVIVSGLGTVAVPQDVHVYLKFIQNIKNVANILRKANENEDVIFVTLKVFYNEISNPHKQPSPVMSIVLQLINVEFLPIAVKFILDESPKEENLERALFTLCFWLTKWTWTDNLGPLILAFMKGLEQEQYYDILVQVTLQTIEPLFNLIILPASRLCVFSVVHYMLSRMQCKPEAFHKIIPHAPKIIDLLSKDEINNSKPYLIELVILLSDLMEHFSDGYDVLYEPLRQCINNSFNISQILGENKPLNCPSWLTTSFPFRGNSITEKIGLYNLGNTCYMNSILQALYMTKSFRNNLLKAAATSTLPLFSKLQILFALLQHSNKSCISPKDILTLIRPPGFLMGQQHDSSEFLGYLLDTLHEQERSLIPNCDGDTTVVQRSFGGKTMTISHCSECGNKSEKLDHFRELQLSFPSQISDVVNINVQHLLTYFLQSEKLCGDNQYRCDVCDKLTDGERITKIVNLPTHLILTLKHFRYDQKSQTRTKLLQDVKFDNRLSLDGIFFDLYAAVVHYGTNLDSGHYYTFAKEQLTGWYKFNDSIVNKTVESNLHLLKPPETGYILFYAREDLIEPADLLYDQLSMELREAVLKDNEKITHKSALIRHNKKDKNDDDDDNPTPPGCGEGSFNNTPSGNMFVF